MVLFTLLILNLRHNGLPVALAAFVLLVGILSSLFGLVWGIWHWIESYLTGTSASTGTVMLAALPLILGVQFILQAIILDIQYVPTEVIDPES